MPRRSTTRLTKRIILDAPAGSITWDSGLSGFGVRTTAAGSRTFIIQYRNRAGQHRRMTVGPFPVLTVDQARERASDLLRDVAHGLDPLQARREARCAMDVTALAEAYLVEYAKSRNLRPRTVQNARHVLERHALPDIGRNPVMDISIGDVRRIHGRAREESGRYQANRTLAVLSKMFNLAIEMELRSDNPCRGVKKFNEDQRWRNLNELEVSRLLMACDTHVDQQAANAVRLLLFTGARLQEVLRSDWMQFDLEAGIWEKPSAHTKQKRQHRLPLGGPALDLIRAMRASDPDGRLLFPGRKTDKSRSDLKIPWRNISDAAGLAGVRLHDLRRTTASFMISTGASLPVVGSALGHTQVSTTARYAQLADAPRREALTTAVERMVAAAKRHAADAITSDEGSALHERQ